MRDKIKKYIKSIKTLSFVDWVVKFRFFGYGVITTNLIMMGIQESMPELIMFGGIIVLIEKQVRKK